MRKMLGAVAAAAVAGSALPAGAANVDFLGFTHGSETVSFSLTAPNAPKSGTVSAGGFSTSLNGGPSFETFCVDVYQTISFSDPAYANYNLVPGAAHAFANPNANADLGRLFAEGHALTDAKSEAAFQIAVWEITYETTGTYNLGSGSATFSGGTAASDGSLALATTWLAGLGHQWTPGVMVLESREHQDVIFAAPVPEPETYALMFAGLMATTFVARRRNHARR